MPGIWLPPAVLGRTAITQLSPSVRGRNEHVNVGKFRPVFAQASPLVYLSPTYLTVIVINEVREENGERLKAAGQHIHKREA